MNFGYSLSGGAPVIKKFRVASASSANAGGYVTGMVANGSGVVLGLATTAADQVGSSLDAATGATAPTSDTAAVTSVIVNNDAVYKLLIVKGATGGQLDILTESAGGSKTANTITTAEALDFLARLKEEYNQLAGFFQVKSPKELDSPDTSPEASASIRFSEEPATN